VVAVVDLVGSVGLVGVTVVEGGGATAGII